MAMTFQTDLNTGLAGESEIAKWLRGKGGSVLPVYEKIIDTGKGPQLFSYSNENLVAPDMIVFTRQRVMWVEAKTKTGFTWYFKGRRWTTGIDERHFLDYVKVRQRTRIPLWVMFLQKGEPTKDAPLDMPNPSGLFGAEVCALEDRIDHKSQKWANGMIYWARKEDGGPLEKYAELNEVLV